MPDHTASVSVVNCEYTFWYYKKDISGEMVGCDNPDCKHGSWFHLICLYLPKPHSCNCIAQTEGECQGSLVKELKEALRMKLNGQKPD